MPLAKRVSIPLGLTSAATSTDETIQKKIYGSGMTTMTKKTKKWKIWKLLNLLKRFIGFIDKGFAPFDQFTIRNEAKEPKAGFCGTLLATLGASLLGSTSASKGVIWACKGTIRAGQNFYCRLILWLILKCKNIIKANLNLMVLIQRIIYLSEMMGLM